MMALQDVRAVVEEEESATETEARVVFHLERGRALRHLY